MRRPLKRGKDGDKETVYASKLLFDKMGRRQDAFTNYLNPAMKGPCRVRVTILQDVKVEKRLYSSDFPRTASRAGGRRLFKKKKSLCSDSSEPCVVGAQYTVVDSSTNPVLTANFGVIVSAGPFGSPLLLKRSGVGLASVLRDAAVVVVKDLPVGQQAQGRLVTTQFLSHDFPPLSTEKNLTLVDDPASSA